MGKIHSNKIKKLRDIIFGKKAQSEEISYRPDLPGGLSVPKLSDYPYLKEDVLAAITDFGEESGCAPPSKAKVTIPKPMSAAFPWKPEEVEEVLRVEQIKDRLAEAKRNFVQSYAGTLDSHMMVNLKEQQDKMVEEHNKRVKEKIEAFVKKQLLMHTHVEEPITKDKLDAEGITLAQREIPEQNKTVYWLIKGEESIGESLEISHAFFTPDVVSAQGTYIASVDPALGEDVTVTTPLGGYRKFYRKGPRPTI